MGQGVLRCSLHRPAGGCQVGRAGGSDPARRPAQGADRKRERIKAFVIPQLSEVKADRRAIAMTIPFDFLDEPAHPTLQGGGHVRAGLRGGEERLDGQGRFFNAASGLC